MESITLRQLLNIMPSDELVKPSIRLEGKNEFDNQDIFKVDELRESNILLLDYGIAMYLIQLKMFQLLPLRMVH